MVNMSRATETAPSDDPPAILSELEYPLTVVLQGYLRWQVQCAEAAGARHLAPLDVLVLHTVNHRGRNRKLGDICLVLNITEPHVVAYCLSKLVRSGLATYTQSGRDRIYCASDTGDALCARFMRIRSECLVPLLEEGGWDFEEIRRMGRMLMRFAQVYDEAGRQATIASTSAR